MSHGDSRAVNVGNMPQLHRQASSRFGTARHRGRRQAKIRAGSNVPVHNVALQSGIFSEFFRL